MMGILNVTPDSFSDGGCWFESRQAIIRGHEMIAEGADIVDVGGESTRPGAEPVPVEEELRRVLPVIEALAPHVRVSVDTTKEAVAEAAVAAGATLINDVSASLWPVAGRLGVGWVAMHRKGTPASMQDDPRYDDVVGEVRGLLVDRAQRATAAGVSEVWIDPGIGFGKTVDHNLALLAGLDALVATGYPVLVGTSRKRFLGVIGAGPDGTPLPVADRLAGSAGHGHLGHRPRCGYGPGPRRRRDPAGGDPGGPGGPRCGGTDGDAGASRPIDGGHGGRSVKGKWAAGIPPRNFTWVIKDRLAMSERPGGFAPNHRKVRRQEEIIWLQVQGFTRVVSLLPSSHNLQAYEEKSLASVHYPLPNSGDVRAVLAEVYRDVHGRLANGERILVHQEELGDRVTGVIAGYLLWSDRLPSGPQAITVLEHMTGHPMGPAGREVVAAAGQLAPAAAQHGGGASRPA